MLKRLVVLGVAVAVLGMAGNVGATSVKITSSSLRGSTFGGGPFWADLSWNGAGDDFMTFCLELDEHVSLGGTYDYTVSTDAVNGGKGGPDPDPLDSRTAYLFSRFLNGSLGVDTIEEAQALQEAIWRIEQETTINWYSTSTNFAMALGFIEDANLNAKEGYWYGVSVMNLTKVEDGVVVDKQSMLYVPEPGMILLLGSGLLGLGALRRKVKQV